MKKTLIASLEQITDGYPKYLLSLDRFLQQRSGVKHKNVEAFILNLKRFVKRTK